MVAAPLHTHAVGLEPLGISQASSAKSIHNEPLNSVGIEIELIDARAY